MKPHDRDEDQRNAARGYGEGYAYVGVGFAFVLAMLLFGAGGWALDGWLHTRPLFAIVGGLLGGAAGFMSIYTRVSRDVEKQKRERGALKDQAGSPKGPGREP